MELLRRVVGRPGYPRAIVVLKGYKLIIISCKLFGSQWAQQLLRHSLGASWSIYSRCTPFRPINVCLVSCSTALSVIQSCRTQIPSISTLRVRILPRYWQIESLLANNLFIIWINFLRVIDTEVLNLSHLPFIVHFIMLPYYRCFLKSTFLAWIRLLPRRSLRLVC